MVSIQVLLQAAARAARGIGTVTTEPRRRRFTFCHRRPDRSFFVRGRQFPVCARCTGIYVALPTGIAAVMAWDILQGLSFLASLYLCALLPVPMAVDGGTQLLFSRESTNRLRIVTGFLGGLGFGIQYGIALARFGGG